jgi:cytoskeletal protein RodZ
MAEDFDVGEPIPEEEGSSSNRTFLVAAGGIGALLLLSIACMAAYLFYWAPRQQANRDARATEIILENTRVAESLTETAVAAKPTNTPRPTSTPAPTSSPTPTQVVVIASATPAVPLATTDPVTATAAAALTLTAQPTATATALPVTGFADEVGLPGLLFLGVALIAVFILARGLRMRTAP